QSRPNPDGAPALPAYQADLPVLQQVQPDVAGARGAARAPPLEDADQRADDQLRHLDRPLAAPRRPPAEHRAVGSDLGLDRRPGDRYAPPGRRSLLLDVHDYPRAATGGPGTGRMTGWHSTSAN